MSSVLPQNSSSRRVRSPTVPRQTAFPHCRAHSGSQRARAGAESLSWSLRSSRASLHRSAKANIDTTGPAVSSRPKAPQHAVAGSGSRLPSVPDRDVSRFWWLRQWQKLFLANAMTLFSVQAGASFLLVGPDRYLERTGIFPDFLMVATPFCWNGQNKPRSFQPRSYPIR